MKKIDLISNKIKEYRTFLEKSKFKETITLLGLIDNCKNSSDFMKVLETAKHYREDGVIPDLEYYGFESLIETILSSESMKSGSVYTGNDVISEFKKRIWSTGDISKVVQFRNCVTEMLMLDFLDFTEYIELSNEVDRYIQYTLSSGTIK